jgi:glycosyltransferase involved in cell wall biosynthesis
MVAAEGRVFNTLPGLGGGASSGDGAAVRILVMTPWTGFWAVGDRGGVADEYMTFRALVRRGHQVCVAAPAGADYALPDEGPGQLTLHPLPFPTERLRGRLVGQLGRLRDLAAARFAFGARGGALAAKLRPDLILAHTFQAAPWAATIGRRLGVPVVAKFFGVLLLNTGWEPRLLHLLRHFEHYLAFRRSYARVIVLDDGTGGDGAARRLGVPAERLLFWSNGVNVEWGELELPAGGGDPEARRRLGLEAGMIYTLTLANLLPLKRVERVIRAMDLVRQAGLDRVRALIAGDGEMRLKLEAEVERRRLGDRVRFLGAIDRERVPEIMSAANIYVAPHDLTNAGLPTCEAMLCRLPVVAMDSGETRRLVADGETGLVVTHGDVEALAGAIGRLASDAEMRRMMGERAHTVARSRFISWDERVRMEVELLESLARAAGAGGGS